MDSCTLPKFGRHQVLGQDFVNTIVAMTITVSANVAAATRKCQHRVLPPLPPRVKGSTSRHHRRNRYYRHDRAAIASRVVAAATRGLAGGVGGRAGVAVLAF